MANFIKSRKGFVILYGILGFLLQCSIEGVLAEMQNPVMALKNTDADLTIIIPSTDETLGASFLTIKRDNNGNLTNVLFVLKTSESLADDYKGRLTVTSTKTPVWQLDMNLKNIGEDDAGTYICFLGASTTDPIANCGQKLIVIRKPNPPTIKMLPSSSVLEGSALQLVCETDSTSLPPDHGLSSEIWWQDENGQYVGVVGGNPRISVNAQNHLVLNNIERDDKGLKFFCISADRTGDVDQRLESDPSPMYEVIPEFKPSRKDLTIVPDFDHNSDISKKIGEQVEYSCDATCVPECEVNWQFLPPNSTTGFADMTGVIDPKVLRVDVKRYSHGSYRCKAENKHGIAYKRFNLEVLYMSAPTISINGQQRNSSRLVENEEVKMQCVFECNPQPVVKWRSPSQGELQSNLATGPRENVDGGILKHLYTSDFTLERNTLKCEDTGIYSCSGSNDVNTAEGRMQLTVMCPPSSANIEGLELKSEYVWEIPQVLSFDFVLRAIPEPEITRLMSSVNGQSRRENIPSDFAITTARSYMGKQYLTHFTLASRRVLDQSDTDRVFIMTVESSEFTEDFEFTIRPRGPPHEVYNITAIEIEHNAVNLFWRPGFDGGEPQTFTVQHRPQNKVGAAWTTAVEMVPEDKALTFAEVEVKSLRPSTEYSLRVIAFNVLGNTTSHEITFKTLAAPDDSLGGGAIFGIILAVFVLIIIILILLYIFVLKKRWAKDPEKEDPIERIRERIRPLLSSARGGGNKGGQNGNAAAVDPEPKEGLMTRMRNKFKRNPKEQYKNVPAKDYSEDGDDDDHDEFDDTNDDDYINTSMLKKPDSKEVIYENTPMNNNAAGDGKDQPDGKKKNDGELQYVTVDFTKDGPKIKGDKGDKKGKKPKSKPRLAPEPKPEDRVDYSDIDFVKTQQMQKKIQQETEQMEADGDSAVDGGADDGGRQKKKEKEDIDPRNYGADFGTTV